MTTRTALITGSTHGIGLATARALYQADHRIVLSGRDETRGRQALEEFEKSDRVLFVPADVTRSDHVDRLCLEVEDRFGTVDIVVNNVGGVGATALGPFLDMTEDDWHATLNRNLTCGFLVTRRVLRGMLDKAWGRIIFVSSAEGKEATQGLSAYVAAKHAVNGLAKAIALEVALSGVTVNAVCPGLCATADPPTSSEDQAAPPPIDDLVASFLNRTPMRRPGTPEEVAGFVKFLCSDAAGFITGAQMSIDGGQTSY
jgi:3-hydroxybutyrate dehydrogenase